MEAIYPPNVLQTAFSFGKPLHCHTMAMSAGLSSPLPASLATAWYGFIYSDIFRNVKLR